jgi:hypothetical protein
VPGLSDHRFGWVTDEVIDHVQSDPALSLWAYTPPLRGAYTRTDRPLPEAYEHPGTTRRLAALDEAARSLVPPATRWCWRG